MSHKTAVKVAIIMIIVFGAITILYPRIFAPDPADGAAEPAAPPVAAPPPAGP